MASFRESRPAGLFQTLTFSFRAARPPAIPCDSHASRATRAGRATPFSAGTRRHPLSALHHVDGEAAEAGLLVALVHVEPGLAHRLDHLIEADPVRAVADEGEARGLDRLDRADRVPFDARHLDEAADRIAGQAEIVLHAYLGRILDLRRRPPQSRGKPRRRHR